MLRLVKFENSRKHRMFYRISYRKLCHGRHKTYSWRTSDIHSHTNKRILCVLNKMKLLKNNKRYINSKPVKIVGENPNNINGVEDQGMGIKIAIKSGEKCLVK